MCINISLGFCLLSTSLHYKTQPLEIAKQEQVPCCLIENPLKVTISQTRLPHSHHCSLLLNPKHLFISFVALRGAKYPRDVLVLLSVRSHHKLIKNTWSSLQLRLLNNCFFICHHQKELKSWCKHWFSSSCRIFMGYSRFANFNNIWGHGV